MHERGCRLLARSFELDLDGAQASCEFAGENADGQRILVRDDQAG